MRGGTPIDGAASAEYTPSTADVGTVYYYCVVTNTGKTEGNVTASETARVTVDLDPTPVVKIVNPGSAVPEDGYDYPWQTGYVYAPGAEATPLQLEVTTAAEGGVVHGPISGIAASMEPSCSCGCRWGQCPDAPNLVQCPSSDPASAGTKYRW